MKKNFYSLFAAASMMLAVTSCSQEEDFAQQSSGEMVSFQINLEGAVNSRTAGDGMTATKLYYEVYQGETKVIDNYGDDATTGHTLVDLTSGKATVELPLLKGEKYDILFWAQAESGSIYNATDLKAISVNYENAVANNEANDAFFRALTDYKVKVNNTVKLTRPFAQLNIGTTESDWNTAIAHIDNTNKPVTHSYVEVTGLADTFNVLTGEAGGDVTVKFGKNKLLQVKNAEGTEEPTETFTAKENKTYYNLAMNYLLVPGVETQEEDGSTNYVTGTTNVTATFWRGDQELFTIDNLVNVPIQRNYRTNILGNLLADNKSFDVEVVPGFDGDEIIPDTELEALKMAAAVGGEVTLTSDVELDATLVVLYDMVLNLNGYTITGPSEAKDADNNKINAIVNKAKLTINGGTVKSVAENGGSAIYNYGVLTLDGVTIQGAPTNTAANGYASYAVNTEGAESELVVVNSSISGRGAIGATGGAKVVVESGTFKSPEPAWGHCIYADGEDTEVVLNGGDYSEGFDSAPNDWTYMILAGNGAKVTVNGGNFTSWDSAAAKDYCELNNNGTIEFYGGTFGSDPSEWVAEGYGAVEIADDKWIVAKEGTVAAVADANALQEALANSDIEEIYLTNDVESSNGLVFGTAARSASTLAGRDVVIDGNGSTISFTAGTDSRLIDVKKETEGMNLTLKNITIKNKISWVLRVINYNTYGTLTLDNVTITHADGCSANYAVNLPDVSNNCTVVINKCKIGATANALNIWGKNVKANVTDSDLYVIDNSEKESYSVIALNNNGAGSSADGTVVNVTGGSLKAEGTHAEGSDAVRNNTETGVVNISSTTTVIGEIEDMVAIVYYEGSTDYYSKTTLAGAIQTAKETKAAGVRLLRDVKLTETLTIDNDVVLNLNEKTITGPSEARDAENNRIHVIVNNANLTIKNGTVKSVADNGGSAIYNATGATLTIENVEVSGAPKADGGWPSYAINNYGKLTVESATVKSYHGGIATGGNGETVINDATVDVGQSTTTGITSYTLYTESAAKLTVNGGTFANTATDAKNTGGAIACEGGDNAIEINGGNFSGGCGLYGSYVIMGGTFDRNVTSYVAEGYEAKANGNDTWTVVESETEE